MVNLFFVTERCPLSLSLAGYLTNKGEKCIEVLEEVTWIIPSTDARSLCYSAANVLDIIKNARASRIFVQAGSKNVEAIILASALSGSTVYVLDALEFTFISHNLLLESVSNISTSEQTKQNFLKSEQIKNSNEKLTSEIKMIASSDFPPARNWFYDYNFYSVIPASAYSHDNYLLPNFVEEGAAIGTHQRLQALQICEFFKSEANSSWLDFDKKLSIDNPKLNQNNET